MLSKLLAMKVVKMENGTIDILDRVMVIMPVEVIIRMHEMLKEKIGEEEAQQFLYDAGKFQTSTGSMRYLAKKKELASSFKNVSATGDASIEMGREILKLTGMGDIRIKEVVNKGEKVVLGIENSPIALDHIKSRGKSSRPVCHYVRGVLAGVLEAYYQKKYISAETSCRATGLSKECVFEFRSPG